MLLLVWRRQPGDALTQNLQLEQSASTSVSPVCSQRPLTSLRRRGRGDVTHLHFAQVEPDVFVPAQQNYNTVTPHYSLDYNHLLLSFQLFIFSIPAEINSL